MKRRITNKMLDNKIKKWLKVLKLDGWTINAKFVPRSEFDDNETTAELTEAFPLEKVAVIKFYDKYYQHDGHDISWNIDTLILHELIHVLCWEKTTDMPEAIQDHSKFQVFEEFLCNSLAKILFDNVK